MCGFFSVYRSLSLSLSMSPFPEMARQASKHPSSSPRQSSTATVAVPTRSRSGRLLRGGEGPSSPSPPTHGRLIKVTVIKGSSTTPSTISTSSSSKRRITSINIQRKSSENGRKRGQTLLASKPPRSSVKNGLNGDSETNHNNRKAPNESQPRNLNMISINCTEEGCPVSRPNKGDLAVHLWTDHSIRAFRCLVRGCGVSYSTR